MATLTKSTGTVTLTGAVEKVTLPAVYGWVWLKNMSDSDIFAGLSADISEGADGVMTIPAGECGRLQTDGFDSVYLMGLGNALVVAQNYADCPFKTGAKGGVTVDSELSDTSENPVQNKVVTAALYEKVNPNLLMNPDFKINQRGISNISSGYMDLFFADRWGVIGDITINSDDNVELQVGASGYGYGRIIQRIAGYEKLLGKNMTLSAKINGEIYVKTGVLSSNDVSLDIDGRKGVMTFAINENIVSAYILCFSDKLTIEWVKLEVGSIATPFVSPDPATELMKCQRYYQIRSGNNIPAVDMRPNMRDGVNPTITELTDGNYSYSAEL